MASGPLGKKAGFGFLPDNDEAHFEIYIKTKEGTGLDATTVIAERLARATRAVPEVTHTDDMVWQVDQVAQSAHLAEVGDELVLVAGMPPGTSGSSNLIRVHTVGDQVDYSIGGGGQH